MRFVLFLLLGYGVLVLLVYLGQRRLLYFPERWRPSEEHLRENGLYSWPSVGEFRGFLSPEPDRGCKGLVIVFHGNAGAAWQRLYYPTALVPLGYRVLLAEYPGYGGRPGEPSEAMLVSDAREIVARAYREFGEPIYLWGESLGSGVVSGVVAEPPVPIAGVVLLTPWTTLPALAQRIYWFLPARWLVKDRFDNVKNLRKYRGPVAVLIAERDEVVGAELGRRLYESLQGPRQLWVFEGSGHNSWPSGSSEPWWREVMEFVSGR